MADLLWPPQITPRGSHLSPVSNVGQFVSPLTQARRTVDRSGHLWKLTLEPPAMDGTNRAILEAFLSSAFLGNDRILAPDHSYVRRGSFPAVEMINNPYFDGVNPWTASNNNISIAAQDGVLRSTRTFTSAISDATIRWSTGFTTVAFAPYVARLFARSGRGNMDYRLRLGTSVGANDVMQSAADYTTGGLRTETAVALGTTTHFSILDGVGAGGSGRLAGDFMEFLLASVSRCLLVDAGPNAFTFATDHTNAAWTKTGLQAPTLNYYTAPDGTVTGTRLVEDNSSGEHRISRAISKSAVAQDWCLSGAFRRGDAANLRDRVRLVIGAGSDAVFAIFDLTAGNISSAATAAGTYTNARAFISALGNNWYYCCLIGRTDAASSVTMQAQFVQNPSTLSYTGDNASNLGAWRLTAAQSSVPTRLVQTTTATTSGTSPTGGVIHVKGGRGPSEGALTGALLTGDLIEVQTARGPQLLKLTAPLDLDAAGLGTINARPPLRGTVLDGAAVILHNPMGKWMPLNPQTGWQNRPGGFIEPEPLELIEDIAPV